MPNILGGLANSSGWRDATPYEEFSVSKTPPSRLGVVSLILSDIPLDVMTVTANPTLESFEQRSASAFMLTGVLILCSLVVPIGLEALTDWSWASGLVLVGLAVVPVSVGWLGLYPQVNDRTPRLALTGAGAAMVAGIAGFGLIVLVGIAVVSEVVVGLTVSEPTSVFAVLGLSMGSGFSLELLLFGVATWQTAFPHEQLEDY